MAIEKNQVTHRPGLFKQSNKSHKNGRHRSKGSICSAMKGKVSVKSISKKQKRELSKEERRHQAEQLRKNKRDEVLLEKRRLGGNNSAPFLVCLIDLNQNTGLAETALEILKTCDSESKIEQSQNGATHIYSARFKQKFSFIIPTKKNDIFSILDLFKIVDTVVFLISPVANVEMNMDEGDSSFFKESSVISDWGSELIRAAQAQGLPTVNIAIMNLLSISNMKKRNEVKQYAQKICNKKLPISGGGTKTASGSSSDGIKLMQLDQSQDALNLLRKIGQQKQIKPLNRIYNRPYLLTEFFEYEESSTGILKVTGYLRGGKLSANGLVHVSGVGDYQIKQIDAPNDPFSSDKRNKDLSEPRVLQVSDLNKQESLDSENVIDELDQEQTWPTQEELEEAEQMRKKKKIIKKIPKGWSDYQAAWIPDIDAVELSDNDSEEEKDDDDDSFLDAQSSINDENEMNEIDDDFESATTEDSDNDSQVADECSDTKCVRYDEKIKEHYYTEKEELVKIKEAAKLDKMFPDEIDTPQDQFARVRFQKYRGLESFRTSPWDPKENLPRDYARIFQFENFQRTKKRVIKEFSEQDVDGHVLPGWFITVHLIDHDMKLKKLIKTNKNEIIVFGLLLHEHKMSVMNVILKRCDLDENNLPIKSKDKLLIQCGYRRFIVNPIFSQHTNGTRHKYERFFQSNSTTVATFYAPIQYPPSTVLCYQFTDDNQLKLIASGSLLSINPNRLVIKRIVLSGHPFKVFKRSAVIRFMFFNREDINYFKPCKLRTKYGRHGHIKEPLGTHGHMKCIFDSQIKSQDTILLNLYKRVYPKWTYEEYNSLKYNEVNTEENMND